MEMILHCDEVNDDTLTVVDRKMHPGVVITIDTDGEEMKICLSTGQAMQLAQHLITLIDNK